MAMASETLHLKTTGCFPKHRGAVVLGEGQRLVLVLAFLAAVKS
jgi:hypothetical protein